MPEKQPDPPARPAAKKPSAQFCAIGTDVYKGAPWKDGDVPRAAISVVDGAVYVGKVERDKAGKITSKPAKPHSSHPTRRAAVAAMVEARHPGLAKKRAAEHKKQAAAAAAEG